jgi:hypothetical protein
MESGEDFTIIDVRKLEAPAESDTIFFANVGATNGKTGP